MGEERVCKVCADKSDGAHFGVDTCRACAAFFRRSIVMKKKYICRQGTHSCTINKSVRCMCRACRFRKCVAAGMSRQGVQSPRDLIGRRDTSESGNGFESIDDDEYVAYYSSEIVDAASAHKPDCNPTPILSRLQHGYNLLNEKRSRYSVAVSTPPSEYYEYKPLNVYTGGFSDILTPPNFSEDIYRSNYQYERTAVTISHADYLLTIDHPNIIEFIDQYFPRLEELSHDQKRVLFRNFFDLFIFMECACRSSSLYPGRADRFVLSDWNYIDITNLAYFYEQSNGEEVEKAFRSTFDLCTEGLLKPLLSLKPSQYEVLALLTLTFYNIGVEGSTDETNKICQEVQNQVFRELAHIYERQMLKEPSLRLGRLTMLLPALHRLTNRYSENHTVSKIFFKDFNEVFFRIKDSF